MEILRAKLKRKAMADLEKGDIFCHKIEERENKAFEVISVRGNTLTCTSRNMGLTIHTKVVAGYVYFIRNNLKIQKYERRYFRSES